MIRKLQALCRQARHIFRDFIKIYIKAVCKLADGDGNTACAKVVAALNHLRNLFVAEKPLNFSFRGWITLLHLCTAGFY